MAQAIFSTYLSSYHWDLAGQAGRLRLSPACTLPLLRASLAPACLLPPSSCLFCCLSSLLLCLFTSLPSPTTSSLSLAVVCGSRGRGVVALLRPQCVDRLWASPPSRLPLPPACRLAAAARPSWHSRAAGLRDMACLAASSMPHLPHLHTLPWQHSVSGRWLSVEDRNSNLHSLSTMPLLPSSFCLLSHCHLPGWRSLIWRRQAAFATYLPGMGFVSCSIWQAWANILCSGILAANYLCAALP